MIRLAFCALFIPAVLLITPDSAFAQATNSVKCDDGSVVTVSTGTSGGACNKNPGGEIQCGDGDNQAIGGCDSNGKPRCSSSVTGSASCTINKSAPGKTVKSGVNPTPVTGTKTGGNPPTGSKPVKVGTKQPVSAPTKTGQGGTQPVLMEKSNDASHSSGSGGHK
jgi:hypothetical protein